MPNEPKTPRQIKFSVSEDDHRLVRVAAALADVPVAEFCRDLVVREVQRQATEEQLPGTGSTKKRRGTK